MLDYLISLVGPFEYWGYLLFFLVVVLECQVIFGLVMPGESLLLVGGFFAGQGALDPWILVAVITIAAVLGDSIGYGLGRHLGREWLLYHGKRFGLRQEHLVRVDGLFAKHGGKVVFCSHFLYLLRPLMPFVAGDRRMRYGRFLCYNALGCIVWASVFVSFGYVAGESWRIAAQWVGTTGKIVGGGLLLTVAVVWLWRRRRQAAMS
jgi:membrane protein DedA with SNARE-associated domain